MNEIERKAREVKEQAEEMLLQPLNKAMRSDVCKMIVEINQIINTLRGN